MASRNNDRKLGRRYAFVKRRLLRLPQQSHGVEVDFSPLPDIVEDEYGFWLGLVAHHQDGSILTHNIDQEPPNLDEIAHLLAATMDCAHPRPRRRPEAVLVRDDPEWQGMVPYLGELGIEVVITEELLHWDARAEELIDWLKAHWSTWPRVKTHPDKLPIPRSLYDLRQMAHCFVLLQRAATIKKQTPR